LFVKLSCNWTDIQTRVSFAYQGLYLNVLVNDNNPQLQWAVAQFKSFEEYEKHKYSHHNG